ncbi:MAG TPA: rubrerythrin [Desulfobacteraceae bacterium]|nr:rubrerythrin [Desulfobacteraceae bacterium]
MNIYEFAKQMEVDGEQYYRKLADESKSAGLKKIFLMLADEEVKHYQVIDLMSRVTVPPELARTPILDNVKNIFIEMKDTEPGLHIDSTAETQSYRKALKIEEESRKFYQEQAEKESNGAQQAIFLQLAREEGKHQRIMENIVEFVSRPEPGNWLEDAEWHHLDEY